MKLAKFMAALLALVIASGCAGSGAGAVAQAPTNAPATQAATEAAAQKLEKVELKIMAPGDRPTDMDLVLAEIEKRSEDTVNVKPNLIFIPWADLSSKTQLVLTSGEDVDLIFDAPWLHMDQMISQGMYEILDDAIDKHGQNLVEKRGEQMWEANKWDGHVIGIPFGDTFGGFRSYYIRKDIREKLGIAPIQSHQDLVDFLYAVRDNEPGMIPYSMDKGALDNNWSSFLLEQNGATGKPDSVGHGQGGMGMTFLMYTIGPDSTKIHNILDTPSETILGAWREARQLYLDKVINPDILADNRTGVDQFNAGKVACYISNAVGVNASDSETLKSNVPGAEIEAWCDFDFTPGALRLPSDFKVYNFQCVPKVSKNLERSVKFLDWANSSQEIYDLIAYGIEGRNWEPVGEKQYTPLQGYGSFDYVWVLNPAQKRWDSRLTQEDVDRTAYFGTPDNFVKSVWANFSFKSDNVATELAIFNDVETKYMPAIGHGVVDPDETLQKIRDEAYDAIVKLQNELQSQIDSFIANGDS
jgi:putative aldouronate transport system substrate-binding protein